MSERKGLQDGGWIFLSGIHKNSKAATTSNFNFPNYKVATYNSAVLYPENLTLI